MARPDELVLLFRGSIVEALGAKAFVEESGIPLLFRDLHQSSIVAGWIQPGSLDGAELWVAARHEQAALDLLDKFFNAPFTL